MWQVCVISKLVSTNLQFLVCFVLFFLELFFDDELLRNDLDGCVSTSTVAIIGNSYTLIRVEVSANTNI